MARLSPYTLSPPADISLRHAIDAQEACVYRRHAGALAKLRVRTPATSACADDGASPPGAFLGKARARRRCLHDVSRRDKT